MIISCSWLIMGNDQQSVTQLENEEVLHEMMPISPGHAGRSMHCYMVTLSPFCLHRAIKRCYLTKFGCSLHLFTHGLTGTHRQWKFILWWWNNKHLTYLCTIQSQLMHNALPLPPSPDHQLAHSCWEPVDLRTSIRSGMKKNVNINMWIFMFLHHSRIPKTRLLTSAPQQSWESSQAPEFRLLK